ncbi:hypothetical protein CHZ52_24050 [Salmonella enterica]|jgi:hypothetical protein|uniref:Uncharacterized protein n=1 Tax=Klebsiella pneumoniae TaxID=573 RepID=A0A7S5L2T1_KLEPN|nr:MULTISPECIES: hypothetical protein [Enterobacterales]EAM3022343.1 hypothetical protein [Salmonella enterica]EBH9215925.1 hypothetical protein [Salmonella enterica subsp. enterica serovar Ohio]ECH8482910.1 hypothetical protein [Salmonella enterica subsp. enterica serovar Senftenberg]ECU6764298.1 hypothetical protein [Salmonella enterica subsp. enterica serovar Havana]EHN4004345.1 hypothetical protein [Salmonella enterica subsp. enterica serovar Kentucky]KAA0548860.1 hypothetical protein F03
MAYREALSQQVIAISISDSPDMPLLGLSEQHLSDAMTEISRHLLALGSRIVYGGDLRINGFTSLLFELVSRHRRDADEGDERPSVLNYLAWPVHMQKDEAELIALSNHLSGMAELVLFDRDGSQLQLQERIQRAVVTPLEDDWRIGLTAMRNAMLRDTHARIVLGGRIEGYKGTMPGIAEEALMSIKAKQPLFIMGGFGGCARDVAESLNIASPISSAEKHWPGREMFNGFTFDDLNNGLSQEENIILAQTPHVDQGITMILRGLFRKYS